ncbi:MAG: archaeosortase/exosortase family protein [Thiobacillus sp.]|uniref:exosortase/archaeosortase family protein n=1 Tax=Thiobacillus sp. TaxID=924 RepID=UPI00168C767B|nr:exosortase/archaeosortase family protein [Thiobacillus sp.]MCD6707744.1 archaeosortase/exosortase family protein [Thiobacillus sp.]QLQ01945.1 MAG: archaeosortase/exosortase family protein [Thiobacillus sp.]
MFIPVHGDAPYLPDGHCDTPRPQTPYPLWLTLAIFVGVFAVLQWSWNAVRGTWVERLIVHEATVKPAAALIQIISPEAHAQPVATSIKAPGGGLNILNGCEGTEIMFLLVAAFSAVRLGWQQRLTGLALGLVLIFVLNQARILALFYTFRNERSLFDLLHTTVLPAVLIAAVALYFYAVLHRTRLA